MRIFVFTLNINVYVSMSLHNEFSSFYNSSSLMDVSTSILSSVPFLPKYMMDIC